MAVSLALNDNIWTCLVGAAPVIPFEVATAEAQTILKSVNGGAFAAVDAGTTAAAVTGGDATLLYALTVNAADTAVAGTIVFQCKGAINTQYVPLQVNAAVPNANVSTVTTGAINAAALHADASAEIIAAMVAAPSLLAALKTRVVPLGLSVAGSILFETAVADAKTVLAAKGDSGNFAAVNVGTTAAAVTGGTSTTLFRLTVNAADTATVGPICFEITGAGGQIEYIHAFVYATPPKTGVLPTGAIPAVAFATGAVNAAAVHADLSAEIIAAFIASMPFLAAVKNVPTPFGLATAGSVLFQTAVADAKTILKAVGDAGNFVAVNAGTTAAAVTGGTSTTLYRLTVNAADTASAGPICFEITGAGGAVEYVHGYVYTNLPKTGVLGLNTITATSVAAGAIDASAAAADLAVELQAGLAATLVNLKEISDLRKTTPTA